jgi:hypothetical protein
MIRKNATHRRKRRETPAATYLSTLSNNPHENREALVKEAKKVFAFSSEWESNEWNLGEDYSREDAFVGRSIRGDVARGKSRVRMIYLASFLHDLSISGERAVVEAINIFKAFLVLEQDRSNAGLSLLRRNRDVFCALLAQCSDIRYNIHCITDKHFKETAKILEATGGHSTAYTRCTTLQKIRAFLEVNRLTAARLTWSSGLLLESPDSLEEALYPYSKSKKKSRFAEESVVKAIGKLYQSIPAKNSMDRLLVCLASLMVIFGFRSLECVMLPADCLSMGADGIARIHYFRAKRGRAKRRNVAIREDSRGRAESFAALDERVIPSIWVDIVKDIVEELLNLTAEARAVAKWIEKNNWNSHLPEVLPEYLSYKDIERMFSLGLKSGQSFCATRKISPSKKIGKETFVRSEDLREALRKEVDRRPALTVSQTGNAIPMSDVLTLVFPDAVRRSTRAHLNYAVRLVERIQLASFLGARKDRKSAFEIYELQDDQGAYFKTLPHDLRRYIDDVLDRGGMTELAQAEWFGRSVTHNIHYQSKTPFERAEECRPLIAAGLLAGKLPDAIRRAPVHVRDAFLQARIRCVHSTPAGLCAHDFSQSTCHLHYDCTLDCDDQMLDGTDASRREFYTHQVGLLNIQIDLAQARARKNAKTAAPWLRHQMAKREMYEKGIALIDGVREHGSD